ncbi:MAG: UvrD-helicase domain-containing protein [Bacteroidales bacterium]|nr:UvrD-helicase domain-containing protein [Bacteroidales bacterium]
MSQSIADHLNHIQQEAVATLKGPTLIVAGAGSGKTRVLTYKIANLLYQSIPAYQILALTFTNKAAGEMKQRIGSVVGQDKAAQLWMGTFHSIFAKILRFESQHLGYSSRFTIYDTDDAKSLLRSIVKQLGLKKDQYPEGELLNKISSAKNNLITANAYMGIDSYMKRDEAQRKPETFRMYQMYEQKCKQADAMDFDDLLLKTNLLFRDFPEILQKYQERFRFVLVDEYQDTNYAQYLIVKKLSALHKNITVVGDDAQSIYAFRGAKIENILNFKNDYPEHKIFKLEQNYRSTQNIVNAANAIIKNNQKQIEKNLFSTNDLGELVQVKKVNTDTEEGFVVAQNIAEQRMAKQLNYSDFAILYRTNMQSRIMEEALRKKNIPYKIYGGFSFYQRKEIKDLLAYFRVVTNPKDNEAVKRIINYPARGIGKTTIDKLEAVANASQMSIWEVCTRAQELNDINQGTKSKLLGFVSLITSFIEKSEEEDAYQVANYIANNTGILKQLHEENTPEAVSQHENILELLNGIKDYAAILAKEEELEVLTLDRYLENIALMTSQDNEKEEDFDKVTLMTIHSAKGLEYKSVHIVGVEQDLFPSMMAKNHPLDLEEERRLFYVAMTRAEHYLTISYAMNRMKYGQFNNTGPSMFIHELNEEFVNLPEQQSFGKFQKNQSFFNSKPQFNSGSGLSNTSFRRGKLKSVSTASGTDFKASPASELKAGMRVEHERFGQGKILQISQNAGNLVATVFFEGSGQKQLLLKFAKLKRLD